MKTITTGPTGISDSAVRRLSHYLRFLDELDQAGRRTVSSDDLASMGSMTPVQVRKDLSHFGSFGKRGQGYPVRVLRQRVAEILGLTRRWRVCLVGAGRLGVALHRDGRFGRQGFDTVAVFDNDPARIGRRWGNVRVADVAELAATVRALDVQIGIIVTPAAAAQAAADALVEGGIPAILNFAPCGIDVPAGVVLRNVSLAMELEALSFSLNRMERGAS